MRLRERLNKLELRLPLPIEAEPDEFEFSRACQVVEELAATMREDHRVLFQEWTFEGKENGLTAEIQRRFNQAMNGSQRPLALPGIVADVYLERLEFGESVSTVHDCEDCGYELPIITRVLTGDEYLAGVKAKGRRFFDSCPLCGGAVGYCAFYLKNGFQPDGSA